MFRRLNHFTFPLLLAAAFLAQGTQAVAQVLPHTDPNNTGNWVLNTSVSDEFNGTEIDETKWQVVGRDGVYWNTSATNPGFTGRGYAADSYDTGWEFSPDNVRVENGLLKIQTKYDPNYAWVNNPQGYNFEYTTGGVYSKSTFTHGYMEIRAKLPDSQQTGSFWTTGYQVELDVFEAIGKHPSRANRMWSSVHDWSIPRPNSAWTQTSTLPFDFSDGFHIYAAQWDESILNIYADNQLIHSVTRAWIEANGTESMRWPLDAQQHVWADSEIFPWWGRPSQSAPPTDYEVDYIRVWKPAPPTGLIVEYSNDFNGADNIANGLGSDSNGNTLPFNSGSFSTAAADADFSTQYLAIGSATDGSWRFGRFDGSLTTPPTVPNTVLAYQFEGMFRPSDSATYRLRMRAIDTSNTDYSGNIDLSPSNTIPDQVQQYLVVFNGGASTITLDASLNSLGITSTVTAGSWVLFQDGVSIRNGNLTGLGDRLALWVNGDSTAGTQSFFYIDNFQVFSAPGNTSPLLGDVDLNGLVNFQDIQPFISALTSGVFQAEADCDQNGEVNFVDIAAFIAILSGS